MEPPGSKVHGRSLRWWGRARRFEVVDQGLDAEAAEDGAGGSHEGARIRSTPDQRERRTGRRQRLDPRVLQQHLHQHDAVHQPLPVEHERDGRDRHPRPFGDIADRGHPADSSDFVLT